MDKPLETVQQEHFVSHNDDDSVDVDGGEISMKLIF